MKRTNFIKNIFGSVALLVASPTLLNAKETKEIFTFDEIFQRSDGNDILIYFRAEHKVYKYIKDNVSGNRIVPSKQFSAYLPKLQVLIPIKETYTIDDFEMLIISLNGVYLKNDKFSEYGADNTFLRLIIGKYDDFPNAMYLELFLAKK